MCKALEVLNNTLFCPEIGCHSIIYVPHAPKILIASLYHECRRLTANLELQPRQKALIEALAAFRLSPLAAKEDVDDQLALFVSSLGTESPKIREAVLDLRNRLVTLEMLLGALTKKIGVLAKVGGKIPKVCSSVSSPYCI